MITTSKGASVKLKQKARSFALSLSTRFEPRGAKSIDSLASLARRAGLTRVGIFSTDSIKFLAVDAKGWSWLDELAGNPGSKKKLTELLDPIEVAP